MLNRILNEYDNPNIEWIC